MAQITHSEIDILIADGDKDMSEKLAKYLTEIGYIVINTYTGQQCIELIKKQRPHIALVDFKLPDTSGIELLRSIRANSPDTIFIFMSGSSTIDITAESIKQGAYDFIAKPFNLNELELTLHRAIEINVRKKKLIHLKRRNIIIALTLPLWALLGYLLINIFT